MALSVSLGATLAEGCADSGPDLADTIIDAASKNGGEFRADPAGKKLCFVKDFLILNWCVSSCFPKSDDISGDYDDSNGKWFVAYESDSIGSPVHVVSISQTKLTWDYTKEEVGLGDAAKTSHLADLAKRECGIVSAARITRKVGLPNIAAEMPGLFVESQGYLAIEPLELK